MTRFTKLPPVLQNVLAQMKIINSAPEELTIQSLLGVVNFATHSLYDVDTMIFGVRPTSEFFVGLAGTGGMKTTIVRELSTSIDKHDKEDYKRWKFDKEQYDDAVVDCKKNKLPVPEVPRGCNTRVSNATRNGLINTLATHPYCGLFSSEAGEFFNGHTFADKTSSRNIEMLATLTSLWDGSPIERNTGVDNVKIFGRRFSMLFLLQMATAKPWLANQLYSDQGFIHRLLISSIPDWEVPDIDVSRLPEIDRARRALAPFHQRIYNLLCMHRSYDPDEPMQLIPLVLQINTEAFQLMADFSNGIKAVSGTVYKDFTGFTARIFEHTCRIAATLAIFNGHKEIKAADSEAAIELMQFYLEERINLDLGANTKNPQQVIIAEKLKEWIIKKGGKVTKTELCRHSPSFYRGLTHEEREKVLGELQSRNGLICTEERTEGATRMWYEIPSKLAEK